MSGVSDGTVNRAFRPYRETPPGYAACTSIDLALWIVRLGGAALALLWLAGLVRVRLAPPFDGRGRVRLIAIAFVLVGLVAFAASSIPPDGF